MSKIQKAIDALDGCDEYSLRHHMSEVSILIEGYAEAQSEVAALREELLRLEEEYDTLEHANVTLKLGMASAEQRNADLLTLLRSASIDYACCLESGYDRITSLGGDCDSVEKMLTDNPNYARYTAALAKPAEQAASALCLACDGAGSVSTGIAEASSTICNKCDGTGTKP